MFTDDEAKALAAAVRVAQIGQDAALASSAEDALSKILSVLAAAARAAAESQAVRAPLNTMTGLGAATRQRLAELRDAVQAQHKVHIACSDLQHKTSQCTVRPLGCFYWGKVWTLTAWCEQRNAFRNFRMDRIRSFELLAAGFKQEAGKTLADFCARWGRHLGCGSRTGLRKAAKTNRFQLQKIVATAEVQSKKPGIDYKIRSCIPAIYKRHSLKLPVIPAFAGITNI